MNMEKEYDEAVARHDQIRITKALRIGMPKQQAIKLITNNPTPSHEAALKELLNKIN